MIEIILDNNALQYLCEERRYESVVQRINSHAAHKAIRLQFSIINFFEQIQGFNEEHFVIIRDIIRRASILCSKTIIAVPKCHIMQCLTHNNLKEIIEDDRFLRGLLMEFSNCARFVDAEIKFNEIKQFCLTNNSLMRDSFNRIADFCKRFKNDCQLSGKKATFAARPGDLEEFCDFIFRLWKDAFDLREIDRYIPGKISDEYLISLRYLTDVSIHYYKLVFDGMNPTLSDFNDFFQVIYLNICDYIVTSDKKLMARINSCGNSDLKGRAISTEDFINSLNTVPFSLPKRAPHVAEVTAVN